jgi:hypothetical protein
MLKVFVCLRRSTDGSMVAELVNRDDLIHLLQQVNAHAIHQEHGAQFEPYDPEEPEYSGNPPQERKVDVGYLKADYSNEERRRLRSGGRVPREVPIPVGAVKAGFTEDVIRRELIKLLPECRRLDIRVIINV